MKIKTLILIALFFTSTVTQAQEVLKSLRYNTQLYNAKPNVANPFRAPVLPFTDDFSYGFKYPDVNNWIEVNQVFVNATYPVNPPTIGVATFDGLNSMGMPYDTLGTVLIAASADTLTSIVLDLGVNQPTDSVYLSFFYQPQGRGDQPNAGDSLILEFKNQSNGWNHIWAVDGSTLKPFKQVLISVTDSQYFNNLFQFRFRNYASVLGNNDHWNIDYVKLAAGRNITDTLLNDVAIQYPSTGILNEYYRMPWNQFVANPTGSLASVNKVYARNNFNVSKTTDYLYNSEEIISSTDIPDPLLASFNFNALSNDSIQYNAFDLSPITTLPNALIKTTYVVRPSSSDIIPQNDSLTEYQPFPHYLCYHDESAEKAYGILGTGAKAAIKFTLNTPDTIQGIQIQFSRIDNSLANKLFSIVVWSSLFPENIIYQQDFNKVKYNFDSINGFVTYRLDNPVYVSDSFYVGWLQSQSDELDMGFDRNRDHHNKLYYNLGAGWAQSQQLGSVMFHPFIGKQSDLTVAVESAPKRNSLKIYPNPVNDKLYLTGNNVNAKYFITDMLGRKIMEGTTMNNSIDCKNISPGIYLIHVIDSAGNISFNKFVKN